MKKLLSIAAAGSLAAWSLVVLPTAAQADTQSSGGLTISVPNTQVYTALSCRNYPFTFTVNVPEDTDWTVDIDISSPNAWGDSEFVSDSGPSSWTAYAWLCPSLDGTGRFTYSGTLEYTTETETWVDESYWDSQYDEVTGEYEQVWVEDGYMDTESFEVQDTAAATSMLKLPSYATADASPEPIRKGSTQHVKGKITAKNASWSTRPVKYQYVNVQFRKAGTSTWTTLGRAKTNAYGNYTFKTTAKSDGSYRVVYAGTSTVNARTSSADYVDVR